ncbi:TPA: conjugal transfer protein TraL [Vibrio vulnificus]
MLKPRSLATLAMTSFVYLLTPNSAYAVSDDECAIWMCLPTGFTTGCSGAKKAFKKRVKRFKPPLPSFSSCLRGPGEEGEDQYTADYGVVAYIPPRKVCTHYYSNTREERICSTWTVLPEQYLKHQSCRRDRDGERYPQYCTTTLRFTEVYRNGLLFGQTHYY